jgi:hypothetical protein
MLDWIAEKIWAMASYVPALIVDQNSPSFHLVRAMFGLILIVSILFVVAMCPFRSAIAHYLRRASGLIVRRR